MRDNKKTVWIAPVGVIGLLLAGCTSAVSPESEPAPSAGEAVGYDCEVPDNSTMTDVTIAAQPIVSNGALFAGIEEGIFAKHGLELEIQPVANVAASVASVQGGTSDFGFATTITIFQSIDSGVDVQMIAPFAGIEPGYYEKMQAGEEGYTTGVTALVVHEDSGIESPGELEGRTVAVVDARGQAELTTRFVIGEHGGDPDAVNYTVLSFPDGLNTFLAGQVDAIFTAEPFLSQATEAGGKILSWLEVETFHEGPMSAIISSGDFIESNRETVERMRCSLGEALAFANVNHDAIREATAKAQEVDPATLAGATVPYFWETFDWAGLERSKQVMLDAAFISQDIDLESVVFDGAQ